MSHVLNRLTFEYALPAGQLAAPVQDRLSRYVADLLPALLEQEFKGQSWQRRRVVLDLGKLPLARLEEETSNRLRAELRRLRLLEGLGNSATDTDTDTDTDRAATFSAPPAPKNSAEDLAADLARVLQGDTPRNHLPGAAPLAEQINKATQDMPPAALRIWLTGISRTARGRMGCAAALTTSALRDIMVRATSGNAAPLPAHDDLRQRAGIGPQAFGALWRRAVLDLLARHGFPVTTVGFRAHLTALVLSYLAQTNPHGPELTQFDAQVDAQGTSGKGGTTNHPRGSWPASRCRQTRPQRTERAAHPRRTRL